MAFNTEHHRGGIMQGSGNTPPWKLEAKAKYSKFDSKRAQAYFGKSFSTPPNFPIMSLLVRILPPLPLLTHYSPWIYSPNAA